MTEAQLLSFDAFNRLVLENELRPWEVNGYVYAGYKGPDGYELYRAYGSKWWMMFNGRRINTSPAGGGVLQQRITIASGMAAKILGIFVQGPASAGATNITSVCDEDGSIRSRLCNLAAGASTLWYGPSTGTGEPATGKAPISTGTILGPGDILTITSSASLQNETQTVGVLLQLPISATLGSITWDNTGSAAGATLAASTISDANTFQAVLLP